MSVSLRPYQIEFIEKTRKALSRHQRVLSVMPTGGGKTICFAEMSRLAGDRGRSTLILAHTDELCAQAVMKLQSSVGIFAGMEKAAQRCTLDDQVVVGSVQSMGRPKRLERFAKDRFDLIIIDEAHRAVADTYLRVVEHFEKAFVVGVTATGYRGDAKSLGDLFETIAVEIALKRLIQDGFLSRIVTQTVPLEIDISEVKQRGGEYDAKQAANAIEPFLGAAARAISQYAPERKGMIFLPLVETSKKMTKALRDEGFEAEHIDGSSDRRREIIAAFGRGDIQILTNAQLLTEGFDEPSVSMVMVMSPCRSRGRYVQMVGRGTRLCEGKENLLLLDPLFNGARHNLCTPATLVAKNERQQYDTKKKIRENEGQLDLLDAFDDACAEIEAQLRDAAIKNSGRAAERYNPVDLADRLGHREIAFWEPATKWEEDEVTEKQAEILRNNGLDPSMIWCKGQAAAAIDIIFDRRAKGLCTLKQMRILNKYGVKNAENLSFDQARSRLDSIFEGFRGKREDVARSDGGDAFGGSYVGVGN